MEANTLAWELMIAGCIFGGFWLAALLVRLFWMRFFGARVQRTATGIDDAVLMALRRLVVWGIILMGLYSAADSFSIVESNPQIAGLLGKALSVGWVFLAIWTV